MAIILAAILPIIPLHFPIFYLFNYVAYLELSDMN
jgi:hypothetical protein